MERSKSSGVEVGNGDDHVGVHGTRDEGMGRGDEADGSHIWVVLKYSWDDASYSRNSSRRKYANDRGSIEVKTDKNEDWIQVYLASSNSNDVNYYRNNIRETDTNEDWIQVYLASSNSNDVSYYRNNIRGSSIIILLIALDGSFTSFVLQTMDMAETSEGWVTSYKYHNTFTYSTTSICHSSKQ
ncbi:hypothetical protein LXL04_037561 [Taraxacum kok-saghyz]